MMMFNFLSLISFNLITICLLSAAVLTTSIGRLRAVQAMLSPGCPLWQLAFSYLTACHTSIADRLEDLACQIPDHDFVDRLK